MALVGVRLTAQLGDGFWSRVLRFIVEPALWCEDMAMGLLLKQPVHPIAFTVLGTVACIANQFVFLQSCVT